MNFDAMNKKIESVFDHEAEIVSIWDAAKLSEMDSSPDRFPIGFNLFSENMKGGVGNGDLITIAGKTGEGKTTFAQTLSFHFNKIAIPQLWFSYEIDIEELRNKFAEMGLDENFVGYCPIKIKSNNLEWIEERILQGITKFNTKVIFIDHLGFLTPKFETKDYDRNYSAYLGHIARQLKNIARDNKIIIFLLAHTKKTKDELDLEDIAYSGGIAQESDFVFLIEREKMKAGGRRINDKPEGDIFTPYSKISLVKNRRTGITKFIKCRLLQGRLMEETYGNIEM